MNTDGETRPERACGQPGDAGAGAPGSDGAGSAVPLDSPFYLARPVDAKFYQAIARQDSLVLIKGARHMGKASLLVRGLQEARRSGAQVVLTDVRRLGASQLTSSDAFLRAAAEEIADRLGLALRPGELWNERRGANVNFERYLRKGVLEASPAPFVWGLDEVDLLFTTDFGSEVFGLFRSWHNKRSLDPAGPWSRLTLAIAYSTEAHLFITDVNQSPFNVGTKLALDDFTQAEVAELNTRHGSPLKDRAELERFFRLTGGHPFLVQSGLQQLASRGMRLDDLEARVEEAGLFGTHLQEMLQAIRSDPAHEDAVRNVLNGGACPTSETFYSLRSRGVILGESVRDARLRCRLYATYLENHLG